MNAIEQYHDRPCLHDLDRTGWWSLFICAVQKVMRVLIAMACLHDHQV